MFNPFHFLHMRFEANTYKLLYVTPSDPHTFSLVSYGM